MILYNSVHYPFKRYNTNIYMTHHINSFSRHNYFKRTARKLSESGDALKNKLFLNVFTKSCLYTIKNNATTS
jgi:hypothetical protein